MDVLLYLSQPVYVLGIFFITLTAIAFGLRLYTKHINKSRWGLDDLFLLFAIICFDAENTIQIYCLRLAREIVSPVEPLFTTYLEWVWISTTFAVPTLTFIKLSVLFFYRRIFTTMQWFRTSSVVLVVVVVMYGVTGTLGDILQCIPPRANWSKQPSDEALCMPYNVYDVWLMSYVIIDTILDAVVLTLPVVMISRLQLPIWKRRSLIAIFLLGGFTVATNIIRLSLMNANKKDSSKIGMIDELWITIHCGCGIVCACLPLYGPLVSRFSSLASNLRQSYSARKLAGPDPKAPPEAHEEKDRPSRGVRSSYIRMENEGIV